MAINIGDLYIIMDIFNADSLNNIMYKPHKHAVYIQHMHSRIVIDSVTILKRRMCCHSITPLATHPPYGIFTE